MNLTVWKIFTLLGAVILIGTAGASDLDTISLTQIVIQVLVGLALVCVGLRGTATIEKREEQEYEHHNH